VCGEAETREREKNSPPHHRLRLHLPTDAIMAKVDRPHLGRVLAADFERALSQPAHRSNIQLQAGDNDPRPEPRPNGSSSPERSASSRG
jgi:hypothetical protein